MTITAVLYSATVALHFKKTTPHAHKSQEKDWGRLSAFERIGLGGSTRSERRAIRRKYEAFDCLGATWSVSQQNNKNSPQNKEVIVDLNKSLNVVESAESICFNSRKLANQSMVSIVIPVGATGRSSEWNLIPTSNQVKNEQTRGSKNLKRKKKKIDGVEKNISTEETVVRVALFCSKRWNLLHHPVVERGITSGCLSLVSVKELTQYRHPVALR